MRGIVYAKRVTKELLRDPLSYIFCLGFPIFMLVLFTAINASMPPEAQQAVFRLESITPGIGMFGLTFVMLFVAIQLSKDRETSFLTRLYTSPMKAADFVLGYALPALVISVAQMLIAFAFAAVLGLFIGESLPLTGCLLSTLSLLPRALLFIALGILFGSILSDKSAPAVTSILITAASLLGGVWMPLNTMEGLRKVCACLPFYHSVEAARAAMSGGSGIALHEGIVALYTLAFALLAVLVFRRKMKN
ncbi:MAG: ABC transporter permease [Oscillospiraceae bacterium]